MQVKVRLPEKREGGKKDGKIVREGKMVTVEQNIPDVLPELIKVFGEKVVASRAHAKLKIEFQDGVRAILAEGGSADDVNKFVKEWKPGERVPRTGGGLGAVVKKIKSETDPAKRKAMIQAAIAQLQESAQA